MVLETFQSWQDEALLRVLRSNPDDERFRIERSEKSDGIRVLDASTGVLYILFHLHEGFWSILSDDLDEAWYESSRPARLFECWQEIELDSRYFSLSASRLY